MTEQARERFTSEMRAFLAGITDDRTLSKRLDVVQAQIPRAHEMAQTGRFNAELALEKLRLHEQLIIARRMEVNFS